MHIIIITIFLNACSLIILKHHAATSLLFSDDMFTGMGAGQPDTHMRSTNSKPQPANHPINFTWTKQVPPFICPCLRSH